MRRDGVCSSNFKLGETRITITLQYSMRRMRRGGVCSSNFQLGETRIKRGKVG